MIGQLVAIGGRAIGFYSAANGHGDRWLAELLLGVRAKPLTAVDA
jgi:hypothetical protein